MTQTKRKGTYALFLTFRSSFETEVGSLGKLRFGPGVYCYIGSAMGGLDQRLERHLRKEKTIRWHIDRLTVSADSSEAWISYPDFIEECELAHYAEQYGMVPVHPGFGCSDCRCATHLFSVPPGTAERFLSGCGLKAFHRE